jgi:hypothetical protein
MDHMRLPTGYGPDGGAIKFEAVLNALTPSEFETFQTWSRGLSRGDQDAILGVPMMSLGDVMTVAKPVNQYG